MKHQYSFLRGLCACLLLSIYSCGGEKSEHSEINIDAQAKSKVTYKENFGNNIIVLADLSNRVLNQRRYEDPEVLKLITDNLKEIFQESISVGINDKFYFATVNSNDFENQKYSDSIFRIDLTKFGTNAISRSDYLHHNDTGTNSLQHDIDLLNSTFSRLYYEVKKQQQKGADLWYYLQDKLTSPIVDTTSHTYEFEGNYIVNKYRNYVIIITDGYIEAERYGNSQGMRSANKFRYLSDGTIDEFRNKFSVSQMTSYSDFFKSNAYGIMPVQNELLNECKFLILEMYDRSRKNGMTTKTPTDLEILKLFWKDWLMKSGVEESNVMLKETLENKENLKAIIQNFLREK